MDGLFPPDAAEKPAASGAYRVLARKYRPQNFDDLIGQEPMVRTLSNAFQIGRIAQGWMLTGVRGVGKTTTARILARALNYEIPGEIDRPTIEMPKLGVHCKAIMEGRHVDVIEMDAASHTGIGDIREIIEAVRYKPVSARMKVYIIDEVHMLSSQAFNGLLKTLEEPPEHVKFIFATTEIRKVPITILSRCQRFDLRRIEAEVLVRHLRRIADAEAVEIDDEALRLVARAAEGSVRDSLSLLDQAIAHGDGRIEVAEVRQMLGLADRARIIDLFEHLMKGDAAGALAELRAQWNVGADPAVVIADLADFTHFVTRLKLVPEAAADAGISEDERVRGGAFAAGLSLRVLSRAWQMLLKGHDEVKNAPKALAAAEMLLVRLAYAADLPTPDEALKMLRQGAAPAGTPAPSAPRGPGGGAAPTGQTTTMAVSGSGGAQARQADPSPVARLAEPDPTPRVEPESPPPPGPRLVASNATPTPPAPKPAVTRRGPALTQLADVAALAAEHRDIRLKIAVERQMRPVAFQPGRIDVSLEPGAAFDLPQDLARKLSEWTGERWIVAVSREAGGATVAEEREQLRDRLVTDARAEPLVAAVLKRFPGAAIVDVRVRSEATEETGDTELAWDAPPAGDEGDPGWTPDD
ncbi:DNA polymerase III subunit gamma/tau [Pinisolibacter aquiterrae]|uniref:DNA polymerase III subunit gamma/tau n=1 Tax=Pinisolibacter aquiterrae TaxID=2815579 RepID=UPI001C3DB1CB|nr:DNA polymerase III subunit gamma/tau [Pinisolibacter aquiterrae]MBV5263503.1 DNA polymerase III subunit gamma/tau [Pinisolibacter aquiterrae]MCC8237443.1 DNA polymerase III subunit gamma/tau [Pinisolibacter aquiterrae]